MSADAANSEMLAPLLEEAHQGLGMKIGLVVVVNVLFRNRLRFGLFFQRNNAKHAGCCLPLASAQLLRWRAGVVFKAIGTIISADFVFPI